MKETDEGVLEIHPLYSDFYTEEGKLKQRCQSVNEAYIEQHIKPKYDETLVKVFFDFWQETEQWAWFDAHNEWAENEPPALLEVELEDGSVDILLNPEHNVWLLNEPTRPELQDYETWLQTDEKWMKLRGVEFDGMMCSATKEDMWGLNSIQAYVSAGMTTKFKFDNGNELFLTPENYQAFMDVWVPFRQSFFL